MTSGSWQPLKGFSICRGWALKSDPFCPVSGQMTYDHSTILPPFRTESSCAAALGPQLRDQVVLVLQGCSVALNSGFVYTAPQELWPLGQRFSHRSICFFQSAPKHSRVPPWPPAVKQTPRENLVLSGNVALLLKSCGEGGTSTLAFELLVYNFLRVKLGFSLNTFSCSLVWTWSFSVNTLLKPSFSGTGFAGSF